MKGCIGFIIVGAIYRKNVGARKGMYWDYIGVILGLYRGHVKGYIGVILGLNRGASSGWVFIRLQHRGFRMPMQTSNLISAIV